MLGRQRCYETDILNPLLAAERSRSDLDILEIGRVTEGGYTYPIVVTELRGGQARPQLAAASDPPLVDVLISGGVHGSEPAGALAAVRLITETWRQLDSRIRLTVIPCANPHAYETATLVNDAGVNLNREFQEPPECREAEIIQRYLAKLGRRFYLTIDLHEDDPEDLRAVEQDMAYPNGFYLYECCADHEKRVGRSVVGLVRSYVYQICDHQTIDGDTCTDGVVWYPEGCANPVYAAGTTLEGYLYQHYTDQALTTETPTVWRLADRIKVQLLAVQAALDQIKYR
jgi:hypothetical protein